MRLTGILPLALLGAAATTAHAAALTGRPPQLFRPDRRELLQDVVTYDNYSLLINGERLMIYSGEFHPFRLPVPSLWLDVFQKVKALGLNTVSFYLHWGLLEGKSGDFNDQAALAIEPFLQAAQEAGLYLIARPGPYINAEATGGGFPGWLQRIEGKLRTNATDYLNATNNYMANVGAILAKYQITNGGPIILVQVENEYTDATSDVVFPNGYYMQYIEDQLRDAGIVVPLVNNDASPDGHNAPGTGVGQVDIYGHDSYPLGFDCANPSSWPSGSIPTDFRELHLEESPTTPYLINEFQGGSFDPPSGAGYEKCADLLNMEFERVFYKNNYAAGVTIFSLYMIFGGTNWGNIQYPGVYASYDYGSAIRENRAVDREKYSELKLEANFLKVSPGYLIAVPATSYSTGVYNTNADIVTTPVLGTNGSFFIVRHADYTSEASTNYTLSLPTSAGTLAIPQLGGSLTLNGRDSKVHVTDYPVGTLTLLYSTAEIFTWQAFEDKTVLVVYGGADELHELAVAGASNGSLVEGSGVTIQQANGSLIAQWETSTSRRIVQVGDLYIYILDRNSAYNYWVPELTSGTAVIVNGPYLVRTASVDGSTLSLRADFNKTTALEIIGAPSSATTLQVNNQTLTFTTDAQGSWSANASYAPPTLDLPDLASAVWYTIDSLPEIQASYDDSAWPDANHTNTTNPIGSPLKTPVSLYGSDYGFNTGSLLFRGHFVASGSETSLSLTTQGGEAYGASVWLNGTFLGSWTAGYDDIPSDYTQDLTLPSGAVTAGQSYVLTVLIDNMGLDENGEVGADEAKDPRGILDYTFASDLTWKITGNLGGENYADRVRGPLNEGGLFAERQGYHQPFPPVATAFTNGSSSPFDGIDAAGVAFYTTSFTLSLPADEWDIPLSLVFANDTEDTTTPYRLLIFVNGYQLGRYTSNVGPQTEFPIPEGVLNYSGENWLGLTLWALESEGAKVAGLNWTIGATPVWTGRETPTLVDQPAWTERPGAY
ncbi:family 35 glycoside hydrolase [Cryphonectria parasitica EP155]|uniref:Beta-galactosidase n=1 Tax=Cryphonectria parasitica (strain ATCC 38755 / EP155) TaxID=660469 RepID=A0A9P4Y9U5_CRYP1|nr:family 35 glycoside hydrolase [Cryphonectria parasitica EP155]KAF3768705.1 family 35 glycoside hydrolase [Cryphonectria parasitica EP155]